MIFYCFIRINLVKSPDFKKGVYKRIFFPVRYKFVIFSRIIGMNEEEKRVIKSLHEILKDLLVNNINIYGVAIANPSGHIVTSDFQSEKPGFPLEIQQIDKKQTENLITTKEEKVSDEKKEELIHSEDNSDGKLEEPQQVDQQSDSEEGKESEMWSEDKTGIFFLAFSYGMMLEVIDKIGEFLKKGKIKSMYIKSTYSNLVIIPVTPTINLLLIITSGKGFDFRFFTESKTLNKDFDDVEEIQLDYTLGNKEDEENRFDEFFDNLREELPGLLGAGHVGINDQLASFHLFGSFKMKKEGTEKTNEKQDQSDDFRDSAAMLSYLFYIGQRLIEEERNLEFDLIQLEYEKGYVLLKPRGNIALIFDTEKTFNHAMIEPNLPAPHEFQQIIQNIENLSNRIDKIHENINMWVEKGVKLLQKKRPHEAIEYFTKALGIKIGQTSKADYWYTSGRALGDLAKYQEAIACFKQVHKEDPTHIDSWKKQAKANFYAKQEKKAVECLKKVTKLDRKQDEVFTQIGEIYSDLKNPRRAIQYYKKGLKLNPALKSAWFGIGHAYFDVKRYKKAKSCYEKILDIEKEKSSVWIGIGWALNKLKKYHKSIECFDIAISIDPDSAVAWNNRGCCFYRLKNYEEAMKCYEKSMRLDPLLKYPWGNIGEVNKKYGNYQIAVDYTVRAHELDPKDRDYIRNLRKWKRRLKWVKRKFLRKLNDISKSNPKILMTDLNNQLQTYIKPLLKVRTNYEDLLRHLIRSNQLKAKITEDTLEFVQ